MKTGNFNGVDLTSDGGGTNYLADDGTYKAVSGGSQDLDSVLTEGNTSTLGATFGDNVTIENNGILFVDGTTGHRGVDWKTNGILNWAWLMSSTDNIKLNKYNTTTGLYVSTPLEFEHSTNSATFGGAVTVNGRVTMIPQASDPSSLNDGDMWVTTAGDLKVRLNGATKTVTVS